MKKMFTLTDEDMESLLRACAPVAYIIAGGRAPRSPQENANDAWASLGAKMGFDSATVKPIPGKGDKFFMAEPTQKDTATPDVLVENEESLFPVEDMAANFVKRHPEIAGRAYIRFDGPPSHESGRFIETECDGMGISLGEWVEDGDDWLLVLPPCEAKEPAESVLHAPPMFPFVCPICRQPVAWATAYRSEMNATFHAVDTTAQPESEDRNENEPKR